MLFTFLQGIRPSRDKITACKRLLSQAFPHFL